MSAASSDRAPDEATPLLHDQSVEAQPPPEPASTSVPKAQLAVLCAVRLVEPVAFTQLFPYVNEFMRDLHLTDDPSRVGFYSGIVESAFALAQLASIYQWARLSDAIGRRPVVLMGILVTAIATLMVGLSKSLAAVLIARCIGGLASGNISVLHAVLGELTNASNQAIVFPIYGLIWPLGSIVGPLIGGSFSYPAVKFPQFFDYGFWREYPYFLPCLITALIAVTGVILAFFFLEETLPSKRKRSGEKPQSLPNDVRNAVSSPSPDKSMDLRQLLSLPIIRALAASGFAHSFFATAFDAVFVLFCYSPVHSGGLGFSASRIGYSLAASGAISAGIQVFFMPYLLRTFDCAKMYNFCMALWPFTYIALPILNLIARGGINGETSQMSSSTTACLWVGIGIVLALSRACIVGYPLNMILIKTNAPPASLGQSNGIVQFTMCLARAFAPFLVNSFFVMSTHNNLLGGHLWAVIMALLSILGIFISSKVLLYSQKTLP